MLAFFAYPLQLNAVIFTGVIALVAAMLSMGLFSLVVGVLLFAMVIRYGFRALELQSQGSQQAPAINEVIGGEGATFFKLIGVYLVFSGVLDWLASAGLFMAVAAAGLFYLMLPASIINLAITHSLRSAINPLALFSLMARLGWTYIGMVLVTTIVSSGPGYLIGILFTPRGGEDFEMTRAFLFVSTAIFIYFNNVVYAIMGYVVYQHQEDLGYFSEDDSAGDETDHKKLVLAEIDILMREGRFDDAKVFLVAAVSEFKTDIDIHCRYHQFLVATADKEKLIEHTNNTLPGLLKGNFLHEAGDIYLETIKVDKTYRLKSEKARIKLAEELFKRRKYKLALLQVVNMHKSSPNFAGIPEAYLLAAKIFSEGLNDDASALKLLNFLRTRPK